MERQQNQRGDPAPHQRGGPAPHQVQGADPVPHQRGNPVPRQRGGPVPQQVQGGDPVPQQVALKITAEVQYKAYEFLRFEPKYLKLPRRAPEVEGTRFLFDKERDKTGSVLGDLLKRKSYYRAEMVGDKRRQILQLLPVTKKNESYLKHLGNELTGLMDSLDKALEELTAVVPTQGRRPAHFSRPPALKK